MRHSPLIYLYLLCYMAAGGWASWLAYHYHHPAWSAIIALGWVVAVTIKDDGKNSINDKE